MLLKSMRKALEIDRCLILHLTFPACLSVGDAQPWQVEIGSLSEVELSVLVQEGCKPLQLGKDNEIPVFLGVPVKFGGREVQLGWHWCVLVQHYLRI